MYHLDDTIAAIASAAGGAARGIVRISGQQLFSVLDDCYRPRNDVSLAAQRRPCVVPGSVRLTESRFDDLTADLYLWPTTRSYTREPIAELHTIGSPPIVSAVLESFCRAGARLAEPGEFTLRAFLAGRIDLVQAEAVLGVIDARDASQLSDALEQLAGGLAGPLHQVRSSLIDLLADIEAGLDFVEEDIEFVDDQQIAKHLDTASKRVEQVTSQLAERERHDVLPGVALVGAPNVGKSSLFNALTVDGTALTADQPGTTRDYLSAVLELDGLRCRLIDTAGVDQRPARSGNGSSRSIESAAQRLAARESDRADLRLICIDASRTVSDEERRRLDAQCAGKQIVVLSTCDLARTVAKLPGGGPITAIETSAHRGLGLDALRRAIRSALVAIDRNQGGVHLTVERCGDSLRRCGRSLERASDLNRASRGQELIATELRVALDELSAVVGATYTDDLLDRVFSRFCIGK